MVFSTVKPQTPDVTLSSADDVEGNTVTLACTSASTLSGAETYAWYKGGTLDGSQTAATWTFASAAFTDSGDYACAVTESNAGTSATDASPYQLRGEQALELYRK